MNAAIQGCGVQAGCSLGKLSPSDIPDNPRALAGSHGHEPQVLMAAACRAAVFLSRATPAQQWQGLLQAPSVPAGRLH